MVTLKPEFVATRYPGYFFNTTDDQLYSLKIDGVLKPLRYRKPNHFNHIGLYLVKLASGSRVRCNGGYNVSVKGIKRFYPIEQLRELKDTNVTIPVRGIA